jgi:hypothetical protein
MVFEYTSGELTVILITLRWLQKSGKDWQEVEKGKLKFDVEIFNLRNLSELEIRKEYQIEISNRFAGM